MTGNGSRRAFLFDIDGTLLTSSSAHIQCLLDAITSRAGNVHDYELDSETPLINGHDVAGFTDRQLLEHLVPGDDARPRLLREEIMSVYGRTFAESVARGSAPAGEVVPGARETLKALRRAGIPLGLSTGNASAVAEAKLTAVGLTSGFRFGEDRGFGGRWSSREAVVRAAVRDLQGAIRHRSGDEGAEPSSIALVGDTRSDMRSGVVHGLTPIGVLTGAASADALRDAGALHVIPSILELLDLCGELGLRVPVPTDAAPPTLEE